MFSSIPAIDRIIRSRRRTLSIEIDSRGQVIVRAPKRAPIYWIHRIVREKAAWIQSKQSEIRNRLQSKIRPCFQPGETFLFQGKPYPLALDSAATESLSLRGGYFLLHPSCIADAGACFEGWYKKTAEAEIIQLVNRYATLSGETPERVKLSHAKKRWGSCTPKRTVLFNWRLIMAPTAVLEYVVAHEIAHLIIPDHSPRFWQKVGSLFPDFIAQRRWLRDNGSQLDWENGL